MAKEFKNIIDSFIEEIENGIQDCIEKYDYSERNFRILVYRNLMKRIFEKSFPDWIDEIEFLTLPYER